MSRTKKSYVALTVVLVFFVVFLSCCMSGQKSENIEDSNFSTDTIYKSDKNFKIMTNQDLTIFNYFVIDDNGYVIDEGYHDSRGTFDMYQQNDTITLNYGFGGNSWYERYYDISNNRISRFFERPISTTKELVAYFIVKQNNEIVLVIQNKYNSNIYYKEFKRNFSDFVIKDTVKAEFVEDETKLKISYWINPENKKETEILDLE